MAEAGRGSLSTPALPARLGAQTGVSACRGGSGPDPGDAPCTPLSRAARGHPFPLLRLAADAVPGADVRASATGQVPPGGSRAVLPSHLLEAVPSLACGRAALTSASVGALPSPPEFLAC